MGKERLDEIENPELAMGRMQELYEKKGYPKEWIDKRLRGIAVRQDLTDEWKQRGVASSQEFAILTNEIMHGTFSLKMDEYKQVTALARENLRDHMTDIELILTMLAEATTTKLHRDRDSVGMVPLKKDAKDSGAVAGRTRKDIEKQTGKPMISKENFKQWALKRAGSSRARGDASPVLSCFLGAEAASGRSLDLLIQDLTLCPPGRQQSIFFHGDQKAIDKRGKKIRVDFTASCRLTKLA